MLNIICLLSLFGVSLAAFDMEFGTYALWHSESTYCDPESYLTREQKGKLAGFVPVYSFNDTKHETRGYIGYTESQKTIYIAFQGTDSVKNWVSNLDAVTTSYPHCDGCTVHKGFYKAEQVVINDIFEQVRSLRNRFPDYSILVTGHSLGGALATLCATDLVSSGVSNVRVFNFGSPRVGNTAFAAYAQELYEHYRVTHHKDMVLHVPMHERFTHLNGEFYESGDGVPVQFVECTSTTKHPEDKNCSYQWHITSISDHLWYMGMTMGGDGCNGVIL